MQFNSHATNQDIVSDIDFLATSDSTSFPIAAKTRCVNMWYDRAVSLIFQADGRWEFDDANASDIPAGTMNLVSGTQKYDLGSAVSTFLKVLRVAVKDSGGTYRFLEELSLTDFEGRDPMDATQTSGTPSAYFKIGDYIVLNRIPNYSSTNGIKIYAQKNVSYFTTTDTTKEPGFAATFHRLLSYGPARDFSMIENPARCAALDVQIAKIEQGILTFYSQRSRDDRPRFQLRRENYGSEEATMGGSDKTIS